MAKIIKTEIITYADEWMFLTELNKTVEEMQAKCLVVEVQYKFAFAEGEQRHSALVIGRKVREDGKCKV